MSKKHFIKLADYIREHNSKAPCNGMAAFTSDHLSVLADFCRSQNFNFKSDRWFSYIKGECGPCGGAVKKAKI